MNEIAKMAIRLGLDTADYERGITRAEQRTKDAAAKLSGFFAKSFQLISGAAVAGVASLTTLTVASAKTSAEIGNMSDRLGVSSKFLSQYNHIVEMSGGSLDKFSRGLSSLEKTINQAFSGSDKAVESLEEIGVGINELSGKSAEEQFNLVSGAISGLSTQAEKAAASQKIFGDSSAEMIKVLSLSEEQISALKLEAERYGRVIGDLESTQAQALYESLDRTRAISQGLATQISTELTPSITEVIDRFNDWFGGLAESKTNFEIARTAIAGVAASVMTIQFALQTTGEALGLFVGIVKETFELSGKYSDVFLKRIQRGGLIIFSAFSENADKAQAEIAKDISELESDLKNPFENFVVSSNQSLDEFYANTAERFKGIGEAFTGIINAGEDTAKTFDKKLNKSTGRVNNSFKDLEKTLEGLVKKSFKEAKEALDNFLGVQQQFETPMETLNRQYKEQINYIGRYIELNQGNADALAEADELLKRVNERYIDQKETLDGLLPPMEQLLQDLQEEIDIKNGTITVTDRMIAKRELERMGIKATAAELDEYIAKMGTLSGMDGAFGNGINTFEQLITVSLDSGDFIKEMKKGFSNMFGQGFSGMVEGAGSIAQFVGGIANTWNSTGGGGRDTAGRLLETATAVLALIPGWGQAIAAIAQVLDSISGGKLFGTSFEVVGGRSEINIDPGGVSGFQSTTETRQRSFFRGREVRTTENPLDSSAMNQIDELFESLNVLIQNSAMAVGSDLAGSLELISGQFVQEFDADGNVTSEISNVLGRTYNESFEEFAERLSAENILAGVATEFDDVDALADRFRGSSAALLDFAQMAMQAGADIASGQGLFESIRSVLTIIGDSQMQKPGESLVDTYTRVNQATRLYEEVLGQLEMDLDVTRVAFVRLSADIVDAAGGLEEASALWGNYLSNFYTEQESAQRQLDQATANRDEIFASLGIGGDVSYEMFRNMFETLLPTLSAEATAEWLRAAQAITDVTRAEELLADARSDLTDMISGLENELERMDLSPFALSIRDASEAFRENMLTAQRLGATQRDMATIQAHATAQIRQAIALLEGDIASSIVGLYGTQIDQIDEQIAGLQQQGSQISNINQANQQRYEAELQAIKNIHDFVDSLLLDRNLSPLNPEQQFNESYAQFMETYAAAQGGDVDALNALPGLAQTLLGFGQDMFASSPEYTSLFEEITGMLSSLDMPDSPEQVIIGQNQQLIDLTQQRLDLERDAQLGERLAAVTALAAQIGELTSVTGESFTSLAERLGLPIEQFLGDLGISLDNMTAETVVSLGNVANLLGIELPEIADAVDVSLGMLNDQNSLFNEALNQTIDMLPNSFRAQLEPIFEQLEQTTDPTLQEELMAQFIEIADGLPTDQRDLLAPFFDQIDPINEAQAQIDQMIEINSSNKDILTEITSGNAEQASQLNSVYNELDEQTKEIGLMTDAVKDLVFILEQGG
jgi:hypothetical protein